MSSVEPTLIIVTGPPGSGKTTVAEALRAELGLPLVAKDTLKETLGGELGVSEREDSKRLGAAVFELIGVLVHELLEQGVSLVAEGNFSSRTRAFDGLPPCRIVQVHVTATPEVLGRRMLERDDERHPVHYDREAVDEVARRLEAGEWEALPLDGPVVRLDTTKGLDTRAAARKVSDTLKVSDTS